MDRYYTPSERKIIEAAGHTLPPAPAPIPVSRLKREHEDQAASKPPRLPRITTAQLTAINAENTAHRAAIGSPEWARQQQAKLDNSTPSPSTSAPKIDSRKAKLRAQWPRVTFVAGRVKPWQVDCRIRKVGERFFFATATEADAKAEQQRIARKNQGTEAAAMPSRLRSDALEAERQLAPYGKTINDAVAHYLAHLQRASASVPVPAAIADYLASLKAGVTANPPTCSKRYHADMRARLAHFEAAFPHDTIRSLAEAPQPLAQWLAALPGGASTRNTMRRRVAALFSFAITKSWADASPFAGGKKAKVAVVKEGRKKVKKLELSEVAGLLANATDETLPIWAIAIFAGLRPESEIHRLRWEHIDFDEKVIVVDGDENDTEETKTGRRVVRMSDNLANWLLPLARPAGPLVANGGIWKKLRTDKRRVGFGTPGTETPAEKAAGIKLKPWVEDYTRHSFGSYLVAAPRELGGQDIGVAATQMGNSPNTIRKHYLSLVKPADALKFWSITRDTCRNIIPMTPTAPNKDRKAASAA